MQLPFKPVIAGNTIPVHLILEYTAFAVAFWYYRYLRRNRHDVISAENRLSILIGAAMGAWIGSRLMGFLENPVAPSWTNLLQLANTKTIMGGLFGGLLGVELAKKIIGERASSGDLFTLPLILGIMIGRVGCFLEGTNEFTYGKPTSWITGMDLGDGIPRHPVALYEIVFLALLFFWCTRKLTQNSWPNGSVFQWFMISYYSFRWLIEWIKPNVFFIGGMSSIQWLCILCLLYYYRTIRKAVFHAR